MNNKYIFAIICIVLVFPILITFITKKVNGKDDNEGSLGKTIIIENERYSAEMDMEDFIPCVLMAQMPIETPKEVLKAQAVVIRTYILHEMKDKSKISTKDLGLPFIDYANLKDAWFRKYRIEHPGTMGGIIGNITGIGKSKVFEENMKYLQSIIRKTNGKVLKNGGEIVIPLYHSISSGVTRDGSKVLGKEYSYLKSVKCDDDSKKDEYIGIKYVTIEEFKEQLAKNDIVIFKDGKELFSQEDIDLQTLIECIDYSVKDSAGYTQYITIADTKLPAEDFAAALQLDSTCMEIAEYEKGIRITTKGKGHGFGMSLTYAQRLAKNGASWQEIIKTFYDVTISDY